MKGDRLMRKNSALAFFIAILLLAPVVAFACGGAGACPGTQEGVHGDSKLVVFDITNYAFIVIPSELGIEPMFANGQLSFCYESVHTHDASGTLHIQVDPGNNNSLLRFFSQFLPISSVRNIYVNSMARRETMDAIVVPRNEYFIFVALPEMR